jgi:hemerythrin HHE cation binding domain-containing protein
VAKKKKTERKKTGRRPAGKRKPNATSLKPKGRSLKPVARKKPTATAQATATVKGALKGAVAAVTQRLPGAGTDAIRLLVNDHRELQDLLKRGEETSARAARERKGLLDTISAKLTVHETIEEKVLYPALEAHPETHAIVLEGFQEHHVADLIVKELFDTSTSAEEWSAKFKVLKENIEHHIEEEEGEMFRSARGVMTQEELVALGAKMAKMKAEAESPRRR